MRAYGRVRVEEGDLVRLGVVVTVVDRLRVCDTELVADTVDDRLCVGETVEVGERVRVTDTDIEGVPVWLVDRVLLELTVAVHEYDARADAEGLPVVVVVTDRVGVGDVDTVGERL